MKKYVLVVSVAFGVIILGSIGWWQSAYSEPVHRSLSKELPLEQLNARAVAARDNDAASVDDLATTLLESLVPVDLPEDAKATIKTRLVVAELDYRHGGGGIPEGNVMRTVNALARQFAVPEYAKTSMSQVRFLRANVSGVFPQLLIPQRIPSDKVKESARQPLSPMGATLLTALLLQQKLINEEFQVDPKDWRDHLQKRRTEMWSKYGENKGAPPQLSDSIVSSHAEGVKTRELRELILRRIATMTQADIVTLTSSTLDQLGIPR